MVDTTFGDMQARIADEMQRSDLSSQIIGKIQQAVSEYEQDRFVFNEQVFSMNTVLGTEYYPLSTSLLDISGNPLPVGADGSLTELLEIDNMTVLVTFQPYNVFPKTMAWIDARQPPAAIYTGIPYFYCIFNEQVRLYPIPNNVYGMKLDVLVRFPNLVNPADTNPWTRDGKHLIRAHAKLLVYRDVLRDVGSAQLAEIERDDALTSLESKADKKLASGKLDAWGYT